MTARMRARTALPGALALLLTGCGPIDCHGDASGVDEVLWRQLTAIGEPFSVSAYRPLVNEQEAYLAALPGTRWDGAARSADELGLDAGGIVLYDTASTPSSTAVSVFIASGPGVAPAEDDVYRGPSEIYTCYRVDTAFVGDPMPSAHRTAFEQCPEPLVAELGEDAAFASAEVFDG